MAVGVIPSSSLAAMWRAFPRAELTCRWRELICFCKKDDHSPEGIRQAGEGYIVPEGEWKKVIISKMYGS